MLKGLDSFLAWLSWVAATLLVVMLFVGPKVVAHDKAQSTGATGSAPSGAGSGGGGASSAGKSVFTANCGSCHTLKAAGATGDVGPDLDSVPVTAAQVEAIVRSGRSPMPSFSGKLSARQIKSVAAFVAAQH